LVLRFSMVQDFDMTRIQNQDAFRLARSGPFWLGVRKLEQVFDHVGGHAPNVVGDSGIAAPVVMQDFDSGGVWRNLRHEFGGQVAAFAARLEVAQVSDGHAEDFGHLARVAFELGLRLEQCDDGCGGEACRCPNVVKQSDHFRTVRLEADFLVRFAQRTSLHGFARLEFAAGEGNLTFVGGQVARADRQDQFRIGFERDGDEHGGVTKAWNLERQSFAGIELGGQVLEVQTFPCCPS
jgi:hypothetical protein